MAGQVDGYGPDEFDDLHWDLLIGTVFAALIGGALVYFSHSVSGSAPAILLTAGAILIVLTIISCAVSSFFRRYAFLVWWRKGTVLLASVPFLFPKTVMVSTLEAILPISSGERSGIDLLYPIRRPPVGGGKTILELSAREFDVGVDSEGRVYEWNSWHGKWHYMAESTEGLPVERLRIKRTIFGPVEAPPNEETHVSRVDF